MHPVVETVGPKTAPKEDDVGSSKNDHGVNVATDDISSAPNI